MPVIQSILAILFLAISLWFWVKGFIEGIKARRGREHGKKIIKTSHQYLALGNVALILMLLAIEPSKFLSILFVGGILLFAVWIGYVVQSNL